MAVLAADQGLRGRVLGPADPAPVPASAPAPAAQLVNPPSSLYPNVVSPVPAPLTGEFIAGDVGGAVTSSAPVTGTATATFAAGSTSSATATRATAAAPTTTATVGNGVQPGMGLQGAIPTGPATRAVRSTISTPNITRQTVNPTVTVAPAAATGTTANITQRAIASQPATTGTSPMAVSGSVIPTVTVAPAATTGTTANITQRAIASKPATTGTSPVAGSGTVRVQTDANGQVVVTNVNTAPSRMQRVVNFFRFGRVATTTK